MHHEVGRDGFGYDLYLEKLALFLLPISSDAKVRLSSTSMLVPPSPLVRDEHTRTVEGIRYLD